MPGLPKNLNPVDCVDTILLDPVEHLNKVGRFGGAAPLQETLRFTLYPDLVQYLQIVECRIGGRIVRGRDKPQSRPFAAEQPE